jgi:DNA (cytosine-5)-methyltransferase 1
VRKTSGILDDFTLFQIGKKMSSDGARYKALGNSMAVPVMNWIGKRIELVEQIIAETETV